MPAYAAIPPDDPFAASKGLLDALACEFASPAAAGLTASGLEELLDERGADRDCKPRLFRGMPCGHPLPHRPFQGIVTIVGKGHESPQA